MIIIHKSDINKCCCICFLDLDYTELSLNDIYPSDFNDNFIPNDLLIKSCCNVHYKCVGCLRKIVNDYNNHPINEKNSHICCQYPFEDCVTSANTKNVYSHASIKKICTDLEYTNYILHANQFEFPGYTIINCPFCKTNILLENNHTVEIGELLVSCTQNINCLKRFCFHCNKLMGYYQENCATCKVLHESENPDLYNYYFNKSNIIDNIDDYSESSYLYINKDLTVEIAVLDIMNTISDINSHIICPICKMSLYKTERCNSLSHHNLERCNICSRIGYKTSGLIPEHWNDSGISGCIRFDSSNYKIIPEFLCCDQICYNHDIGDCDIPEHQPGILSFEKLRKKCYVYHMIKSLLPSIRFDVYDILYEKLKDHNDLEFLPFKQTLIILSKYKIHSCCLTEEIVYTQLKCKFPNYTNKNEYINEDDYINENKNDYFSPPRQEIYKSSFSTLIYEMENDSDNEIVGESDNEIVGEPLIYDPLIDDPLIDNSDDSEIDIEIDLINSYLPILRYTSRTMYINMDTSENENDQENN